ncbi:TPA: hypothetical protein JAN72_11905 [Legionella pneumophila]|uniref:ATP-grasp domain-containing protein n=1 Tax=Legionella pneumophila TaxID=446 RepID=A0AAN5KRX8_LEGPN|nr:hypothetical protein [Legionella pneumophila]HAT1972904.1 hypothetical protein [Legionella pneumophila]HAT6957460.1 hypothetical protein [Legionella pneumophila]HEN4771219.1 hypothetical protein [Legionella pneumophila]
MNVLIITEPDDVHATLVQLALEKKNVSCRLFFSADMPSVQKNNILISDKQFAWNSSDNNSAELIRSDELFDSIWWRRPRRPYLDEVVHQEDKSFARKENNIFHDSIPYLFRGDAWWVNPINSHQKSKSKIVQLKLAHQCGFKLPETLISNSPENIKAFIQANHHTGVIYKPFSPQVWIEEGGIKILYTNKISYEDLPSDPLLQVVPGIYQNYVEKKYELRVTCFGSHISAVKIDSQKHYSGQVDWRKIPSHELSLSEVELPQSIKNKIILFMIKIGVVFGCFDFIVTPDDELIFLELNEQGQFLWVEEVIPELCYLDIFSEFIMNRNFDFSWKKTNKTIHAVDLDAQALKMVNANIEQHVYLNQIKRVA